MHLVIDSREGDPALLGNEGLARGFLETHPARIGMTIAAPPMVYTYRGENPRDWGVSGFGADRRKPHHHPHLPRTPLR